MILPWGKNEHANYLKIPRGYTGLQILIVCICKNICYSVGCYSCFQHSASIRKVPEKSSYLSKEIHVYQPAL